MMIRMVVTICRFGRWDEYTGEAAEGIPVATTGYAKEKRSQSLDSAGRLASNTSISEAEMLKGTLKASTSWVLSVGSESFSGQCFPATTRSFRQLAKTSIAKIWHKCNARYCRRQSSEAYRVPAAGRFYNHASDQERVNQAGSFCFGLILAGRG